MIGRVNRNVSESPLGLQSTVVVVLIVFVSTGYFFWETVVNTAPHSQETDRVPLEKSRVAAVKRDTLLVQEKSSDGVQVAPLATPSSFEAQAVRRAPG